MKKYRIAVIGCGLVAFKLWVPYTLKRDDTEIVALMDIYPEKAEQLKREFNLNCGIYTDVRQAITESGANLVYDLTYVTTHHSVVIPALELGCNVFGEKPMAMSLDESMDMVLKAKETGKVYSVMQNRRYTAQARAILDALKSGMIGDIGFVNADIFVGEDLASIRNQMENPMLQDNAIHTFDQVRFFTGQRPSSIYCHAFNPKGSKYAGNAAGVCIFELTNDMVFAYRCLMGADGFRTSWESSWRIVGSEGTIVWDGFGNAWCEYVVGRANSHRETKKVELIPTWTGQEQHFGCLDEMFDALNSGRKSETDCTDNIWSISMVYSSVLSTKEKRLVKIEDKGGYPIFV